MYKPLVGEYLQCVKEPTKWTRMLLLWFVLIAKKEVVGCVQKNSYCKITILNENGALI